MKNDLYAALLGVNVYMPVACAVVNGKVVKVFNKPEINDNFIEVEWEFDEDYQKVFSIKKDIGNKIFFNMRLALKKALSD